MQIFFSKLVQHQASQLSVSQMHVMVFSRKAFLVGSVFCLTEFTRTDWPPVGPRTININNTCCEHSMLVHSTLAPG